MDKGPWRVVVHYEDWWHAYIASDDFSRDVALKVGGDFADTDDRKAYCEWLAGVLNKAAERVPE
jgi:hypothetical protein